MTRRAVLHNVAHAVTSDALWKIRSLLTNENNGMQFSEARYPISTQSVKRFMTKMQMLVYELT
jgi:phage gp37-like protein